MPANASELFGVAAEFKVKQRTYYDTSTRQIARMGTFSFLPAGVTQ